MKKRVLYLSYDGLTDPLGQSQILPYIEGLADEGYTFTIISFEKPERFRAIKATIEQRCTAKNITWKPLTYTKTPPVLSTLYDLQKLYTAISDNGAPYDLIHCRSYLTTLVAIRIKKRFGMPFIFDMRGFWADERVDGKIWNLKNPVYKVIFNFFKLKERNFLEEAAAVVSLTHAGKSEIVRWFNEDSRFGGDPNYYNYDRALAIEQKITVIPCATDLTHFDPTRITENKKKWLCAVHGIDPNLEYLGYVGSLGTWYMADEMLTLYHTLLQSNTKLRFLILSQDDTYPLFERADQLGIPLSYLIHIRAERREVPALMSLMSASVFFILPAYSKTASSPTKQGELMAMGVPIICNEGVGDTADIVNAYGSGFLISSFDDSQFEKVISNWFHITHMDAGKIRKGAEEYFSLKKGIDAYQKVYSKTIRNC